MADHQMMEFEIYSESSCGGADGVALVSKNLDFHFLDPEEKRIVGL